MDLTVAIATYGHPKWEKLALRRAFPSAQAENVAVIHVHGETLQDARNRALEQVETEWVCFLDADDELEPGYIAAIAAGTCDLRAPAVRYVRDGIPTVPYVPQVAGHQHRCAAQCLAYGNWLVIGTVARTELVRQVGGWRDFTWSEDWDLWVRCYFAGATIEAIPDAVYRAHVRYDSRNRAPSAAERIAAHNLIARANGLPEVV